jgi:hypothetical protein
MVNKLKIKGSEWYIFGRTKCRLIEDAKVGELDLTVEILEPTPLSKYKKGEIRIVYVRSLYPRFNNKRGRRI